MTRTDNQPILSREIQENYLSLFRESALFLIEDEKADFEEHKVAGGYPILGLILFGSRVMGNPTLTSDWDIMLLTKEPIGNMASRFERELNTELRKRRIQGTEIETLSTICSPDYDINNEDAAFLLRSGAAVVTSNRALEKEVIKKLNAKKIRIVVIPNTK